MRGWIFFTFLLLCGLNCFSLEKEEYLYLTSPDDSLSGSLITLSTAYINENPQRATLYNAQAINQTNKLNFAVSIFRNFLNTLFSETCSLRPAACQLFNGS